MATQFDHEDKPIAKLYREVIDEIQSTYKFEDAKVQHAIDCMKEVIRLGHKRNFTRFSGINFCKPENRCAYLRRYAVCFTGLVKMAIWRFFSADDYLCKCATEEITSSDHLKIVSLGGGPGNDLIGFCSALQGMSKNVKELDVKIVDISKGWISTLPDILRKACTKDFGSVSAFMKTVKINTGFIERNLENDGTFQDKTLTSVLEEGDVVLMVKLASFIQKDKDVEKLLQNVVDAMKTGAYLIFVDAPFDKRAFSNINGLDFIYERFIEYKLSFSPSKYFCPSIASAQANVCVFMKN